MPHFPPKLVAIGLNKSSRTPLLEQFEALYIYGVLSQLARFTEIQFKDMATTGERITMDVRLSYDDLLDKLGQVCRSARTQYLFTGSISPFIAQNEDVSQIKVTYRLYEAAGNRYVVDEVTLLPLPVISLGSESPFPVNADIPVSHLDVNELNRVINETVQHFAMAVFGDDARNRPNNAPYSISLPAMQLALQAHQAVLNTEKYTLYSAALQEDAQMETAYYHLARIHRMEQEYEKSVVSYRKLLEISRSSARNRAIYATDAGIACALIGKPDFALQWWMKAIEYDDTYISPYFNLANVYEDRNECDKAEQFFLKAQRLDPEDFRTFLGLARVYSKMGAWDKALTQYRGQLRSEDGDPWCHSDVATCYLNLGDVENARQHLHRTVELDPEGEAGQYAQLILGGLG